jgi:hypothetical protein
MIKAIARHRTDVVVQDKTFASQFDIGSGLQWHRIIVPDRMHSGPVQGRSVVELS